MVTEIVIEVFEMNSNNGKDIGDGGSTSNYYANGCSKAVLEMNSKRDVGSVKEHTVKSRSNGFQGTNRLYLL